MKFIRIARLGQQMITIPRQEWVRTLRVSIDPVKSLVQVDEISLHRAG